MLTSLLGMETVVVEKVMVEKVVVEKEVVKTVAEKVGAYELKEGDAQDAAQRLRDKNIVEFVVPNYKMEFGVNPPNDEHFNQQPNLVSDIAASIDLLGAWDLYAKRKEVTLKNVYSFVY